MPQKHRAMSLPFIQPLIRDVQDYCFDRVSQTGIERIFTANLSLAFQAPLFLSHVQAGFPSPGEAYVEDIIDLNKYLIRCKASTFFIRVATDTMEAAGIFCGDLLIIDRSLHAFHGNIIVAVLNGQMSIKRLEKRDAQVFLCTADEPYAGILVTDDDTFSIWGVATYVIHSLW